MGVIQFCHHPIDRQVLVILHASSCRPGLVSQGCSSTGLLDSGNGSGVCHLGGLAALVEMMAMRACTVPLGPSRDETI